MNSLKHLLVTLSFFSALALSSCAEQSEKNVKPPEGVIPVKEAQLLDRTFTETRYKLISEGLGMEDNRSSWWSIEDLENYIAYAKAQAAENGSKVDGMRIYFGAYPKDFRDQKVAGYATLFIVPTGSKGTQEGSLNLFANYQESENLDIPPLNMGHAGNPPQEGY